MLSMCNMFSKAGMEMDDIKQTLGLTLFSNCSKGI